MADTTMQNATQPAPTLPTGEEPKKRRGFATMDPEQVRALARKGGAAAHRAGTAHEFTSDEARVAGRKGGLAAQLAKRGEPSSN